jgi:2-keto-3-deoxy-L-arabinonate dehydratase
VVHDYLAGRRDAAKSGYNRILPLINYENRQCGILAAKSLMKAGGIITCDTGRHPMALLHPSACEGLVEIARDLGALVLNWN